MTATRARPTAAVLAVSAVVVMLAGESLYWFLHPTHPIAADTVAVICFGVGAVLGIGAVIRAIQSRRG